METFFDLELSRYRVEAVFLGNLDKKRHEKPLSNF